MADEISANASLRVLKGYLDLTRAPAPVRATMAGAHMSAGVNSIGFAAHEALPVSGDVATAGWAFFRNLDATHFVQVGLDVAAAFVPFLKLLPGEFAGPVRLATTAVYAKADTAAVALDWMILEA